MKTTFIDAYKLRSITTELNDMRNDVGDTMDRQGEYISDSIRNIVLKLEELLK